MVIQNEKMFIAWVLSLLAEVPIQYCVAAIFRMGATSFRVSEPLAYLIWFTGILLPIVVALMLLKPGLKQGALFSMTALLFAIPIGFFLSLYFDCMHFGPC